MDAVLAQGGDASWQAWILLGAAAGAFLLWLAYLVQPPVRRRVRLRWRCARLEARALRLRGQAGRLAGREEEILGSEAEERARVLLASSWLSEVDGAPGIGPALVERLRGSGRSGPPLLATLLAVPGIGETKARSILAHLARVEESHRERLTGDLREGRLDLPPRERRKRRRLAARRDIRERSAAAVEAAFRAARRELELAPVFRFRTFLLRFPRSLRTAAPAPVVPRAGATVRDGFELVEESSLGIPPHPNTRLFRELMEGSGLPGAGREGLPGATVLPVREIARAVGCAHWVRPSREQSSRLARLAEAAGFALEPDPRLSGRPYALEERVALFACGPGPLDETAYSAAALILRLGIAVAQADGAAARPEVERITREIEAAFRLGERERVRLEALRTVLLTAGSDIAEVTREFTSKLAEPERARVGRFLVAVAASDGAIDRAEVRLLRLAFRRLGLPAGALEGVLEEAGAGRAPGAAGKKEAGAGEDGIPLEASAPPARLELDMGAVQRILAESREVARMLQDAMRVPAEDAAAGGEEAAAAVPDIAAGSALLAPPAPAAAPPGAGSAVPPAGPLAGLPARYAAFGVEFASRARWSREEAGALARRHGHMLDGAIEAINEWAFDSLGARLLHDEGDEIVIDARVSGKGAGTR